MISGRNSNNIPKMNNRSDAIEDPILQAMANCNSLDKEFIKILKRAKAHLNVEQGDTYCITLSKLIIERICRLSTVKIKEKTIKTKCNVYKTLKEYSIDTMLDILIKIIESKNLLIISKVFEIIFCHLEKHSNCNDNLQILYKIIYFSKNAFNFVREKCLDNIFEIFEKRIYEIMKKFPDTNRKEALHFLLKRSVSNPSTFTDNLHEYTSKYHSQNDQTSEPEEFQASGQFKTSDVSGNVNKDEINSRNISFAGNIGNISAGNTNVNNNNAGNNTSIVNPSTKKTEPKAVKINPLKLPIFNEDGFRIVSRSSRRNDQCNNKSYNSCSHRNPQHTISVDSSVKDKRRNSINHTNTKMTPTTQNLQNINKHPLKINLNFANSNPDGINYINNKNECQQIVHNDLITPGHDGKNTAH